MKFFTNKKFLFKLITTLCICLTVINFGLAPKANAEGLASAVGGKLLDPICALLLTLGDGVMEIIQRSTMGTSATAIFDNGTGWWKIAIAILIATAAIVIAAWTGTLAPMLVYVAKLALVAGAAHVITAGGSTAAITAFAGTYFDTKVVLPTFTIGPEEIFSGKILLFDANIFNPKTVYVNIEAQVPDSKYVISYNDNDGLAMDMRSQSCNYFAWK